MVDVAPAPAMTNADYAREKSPYYAHRIDLFDKYYARELTRVEEAKARGEPIVVTLPDGAQKEGTKFATTPFDIALGIHKKLAQNALVAKVDGEFWDMKRPLEGDCALARRRGQGVLLALERARVGRVARVGVRRGFDHRTGD